MARGVLNGEPLFAARCFCAVDSCRLIGSRLYGVDHKQSAAAVYVIEVNDNPNIDLGIEDTMAGDALYRTTLNHLLARCATGSVCQTPDGAEHHLKEGHRNSRRRGGSCAEAALTPALQ